MQLDDDDLSGSRKRMRQPSSRFDNFEFIFDLGEAEMPTSTKPGGGGGRKRKTSSSNTIPSKKPEPQVDSDITPPVIHARWGKTWDNQDLTKEIIRLLQTRGQMTLKELVRMCRSNSQVVSVILNVLRSISLVQLVQRSEGLQPDLYLYRDGTPLPESIPLATVSSELEQEALQLRQCKERIARIKQELDTMPHKKPDTPGGAQTSAPAFLSDFLLKHEGLAEDPLYKSLALKLPTNKEEEGTAGEREEEHEDEEEEEGEGGDDEDEDDDDDGGGGGGGGTSGGSHEGGGGGGGSEEKVEEEEGKYPGASSLLQDR